MLYIFSWLSVICLRGCLSICAKICLHFLHPWFSRSNLLALRWHILSLSYPETSVYPAEIIKKSFFCIVRDRSVTSLHKEKEMCIEHILHASKVMCDQYVVAGWIIHRLCVVIGIPLHKTAKSRKMCIKRQLQLRYKYHCKLITIRVRWKWSVLCKVKRKYESCGFKSC